MQVDTPEMRRKLLSHSLLKSYQTRAAAQGGVPELTVGLLVPHVGAATNMIPALLTLIVSLVITRLL